MTESEEELKTLLLKVKEKSEKAGLKLNIKKKKKEKEKRETKIMAFGHITSWHKDREKVEAVKDFIFYGSKTTVDGAMKLEDACFLEGRLWQH